MIAVHFFTYVKNTVTGITPRTYMVDLYCRLLVFLSFIQSPRKSDYLYLILGHAMIAVVDAYTQPFSILPLMLSRLQRITYKLSIDSAIDHQCEIWNFPKNFNPEIHWKRLLSLQSLESFWYLAGTITFWRKNAFACWTHRKDNHAVFYSWKGFMKERSLCIHCSEEGISVLFTHGKR